MACICTNPLLVNRILLECLNYHHRVILEKIGMTLLLVTMDVRDVLYGTDVITSAVKMIALSPVGKLI